MPANFPPKERRRLPSESDEPKKAACSSSFSSWSILVLDLNPIPILLCSTLLCSALFCSCNRIINRGLPTLQTCRICLITGPFLNLDLDVDIDPPLTKTYSLAPNNRSSRLNRTLPTCHPHPTDCCCAAAATTPAATYHTLQYELLLRLQLIERLPASPSFPGLLSQRPPPIIPTQPSPAQPSPAAQRREPDNRTTLPFVTTASQTKLHLTTSTNLHPLSNLEPYSTPRQTTTLSIPQQHIFDFDTFYLRIHALGSLDSQPRFFSQPCLISPVTRYTHD